MVDHLLLMGKIAKVPIVSDSVCASAMSSVSIGITSDMLCAGFQTRPYGLDRSTRSSLILMHLVVMAKDQWVKGGPKSGHVEDSRGSWTCGVVLGIQRHLLVLSAL